MPLQPKILRFEWRENFKRASSFPRRFGCPRWRRFDGQRFDNVSRRECLDDRDRGPLDLPRRVGSVESLGGRRPHYMPRPRVPSEGLHNNVCVSLDLCRIAQCSNYAFANLKFFGVWSSRAGNAPYIYCHCAVNDCQACKSKTFSQQFSTG